MTNLQQNRSGFTGVYKYLSNTLVQNDKTGIKIIFAKRKDPKNKPVNFLLQLDGQNKRQYLSSLYPIGEKDYCFEVSGIVYFMKIDPDEVEITENSNLRTYILKFTK